MYRIVSRKLPSETNPKQKIIGFKLPINGRGVFNPTYNSREQIKYNLINFLLTNHKERVFNNKFGGNLRSLLFEGINFDELDLLEDRLESEINEYFPLITIHNLEFIPYPDENKLEFKFSYFVKEYNINDEITIDIQ